MTFHANLTGPDIHKIARWEHADTSARLAETVTADDLGKISHQLDADSFWVLKSVGPTVWVPFGDSGAAVSSITGGTGITLDSPDGDVTVSVTALGIGTAQLADDAVTYSKLQNSVSDDVLLGTISGAGSIITELTGVQVTSILSLFSTTTADQGVVPGTGGGLDDTYYLDATGSWTVPGGDAGHVIQEDGTPATVQPNLNFTSPLNVTNNPGNTSTDININTFSTTSTVKGAVPGSNNQSTYILYGDGNWAPAPTGTGDVASTADLTDLAITVGDGGSNKNIKSSIVTIDASGNLSNVGTYGGIVVVDWSAVGAEDIDASRFANLPAATTSTSGIVELASDGEALANVVVQGNDFRLANARTPTAHTSTHASGGSDPVDHDTLLNYLAAEHIDWSLDVSPTAINPANIATFDTASTTPGLVAGSNGATDAFYLDATGAWTVPAGAIGRAKLNFGVGVWTNEAGGGTPTGAGKFTSNFADPNVVTQINFHRDGEYETGGQTFLASLTAGDTLFLSVPDSVIAGGGPPVHRFRVVSVNVAGAIIEITVNNAESNHTAFDTTLAYGVSVVRGNHTGLYSPLSHSHTIGDLDSEAQLVDRILVTDGASGFTYQALSSTGHGTDSIDQHGDVDTTTTPPNNSEVLGWDGSNWVPQAATTPGAHDLGGASHTSPDGGGNQTAGRIVEANGTGGVRWADTVQSVAVEAGGPVTVTQATGAVELDVTTGNSMQVTSQALEVKVDSTTTPVTLSIGANGLKVADGGIATASLQNNAVTYSKMQLVSANNVLLGNRVGIGSPVAELTGTQVTALLNNFTTTLKGLVPPPSTVTNKFLRDDGSWQAIVTTEQNDLTTTVSNIENDQVFVGDGTDSGTYIAIPTAQALKFDGSVFGQADFADLGTKTHTHQDAANGGTLALAAIDTQIDSGVFTFGATGAPTYVGPGVAGTYLRSGGTGVAPTWANVSWSEVTSKVTFTGNGTTGLVPDPGLSDVDYYLNSTGAWSQVTPPDLSVYVLTDGTREQAAAFMTAQAASVNTPAAGKGEYWVQNTTPTSAWFTDSSGEDYLLTSGTKGSLAFKFSTSTVISDPTAGFFRINTGSFNTATQLAININDRHSLPVKEALTVSLTPGSQIVVVDDKYPAKRVRLTVVSVQDNGTWLNITLNAGDNGASTSWQHPTTGDTLGLQLYLGKVTLGKLSTGTPGGIIAYDTTTGVAVDIGAGTAGQVLTTVTPGTVPSWEDASTARIDTLVASSGTLAELSTAVTDANFGSAATKDVGNSTGNVPEYTGNGHLVITDGGVSSTDLWSDSIIVDNGTNNVGLYVDSLFWNGVFTIGGADQGASPGDSVYSGNYSNSSSVPGGNTYVRGGGALGSTSVGGNISIYGGSGSGAVNGNVEIGGYLGTLQTNEIKFLKGFTVEESATRPLATTRVNTGQFWVRSPDNAPMFSNDSGDDINLITGIDTLGSGTLAQLNSAIADGVVRTIYQDTIANQGSYSPGIPGAYFFATDTLTWYYADGSPTWNLVSGGADVSWQEEGGAVLTSATANFVGDLVTVDDVGGVATVTVANTSIPTLGSGTLAQLNTAISDGTVRNIDHDVIGNIGSYSPTNTDSYFYATDTYQMYVADGTNWNPLVIDTGTALPASAGVAGKFFLDTDDLTLHYDNGTTWDTIAGAPVEGIAVKSTGVVDNTYVLKADGLGGASWAADLGGGDVSWQEETAPVVTSSTANFEGELVTVTNVGGVATITVDNTSLANITSGNVSDLQDAVADGVVLTSSSYELSDATFPEETTPASTNWVLTEKVADGTKSKVSIANLQGASGGGGGSGTKTLCTNQSVAVDATEVVIGGGYIDGSTGGTYSWNATWIYNDGGGASTQDAELRLYNDAGLKVSTLLLDSSVVGLDTRTNTNQALTAGATPTLDGDIILNSTDIYEVRLYITATGSLDSVTVYSCEFVEA